MNEKSIANWLTPAKGNRTRAVPWERIPCWQGEAKARTSALAALLGMTVGLKCSRSGALTWRAVAVGDCCLFVVRDNDLAISFPMTKAGEFYNVPSLISSNHLNNAGLWPRARQLRGECLPGDFVVLASDALGCWIRRNGGEIGCVPRGLCETTTQP